MDLIGGAHSIGRIFIESLPMLAAMVTLFMCGFTALTTNNMRVKTTSVLSIICALLLMVAQASWSWSYFIKGDLLGTDTSNIIWSIFNTLVMGTFCYNSYWIEK